MAATKGKFKLVFIPADPQESIEEKELTYTEETEVSCVQDCAKVRRSVFYKRQFAVCFSACDHMKAHMPQADVTTGLQDLQAHFRLHKPKKTEAQSREQREQFLQQVPEEQRHSITDDLIDQATSMNLVRQKVTVRCTCKPTHRGFLPAG